jgi:hypothetical protein
MILSLILAASLHAAPQVETRDCLNTTRIKTTAVLDDKTILFEMRDGSVWQNTLKLKCPSLGFNEAFIYESRGSQLCAIDTIQVFDRHIVGARCGLSKFQSVEGSLKQLRAAFKAQIKKQ